MDFKFTSEQEELIKKVTEFCRRYCSDVNIAQLEEAQTDSPLIEQKLAEEGWYGLPFPAKYGGQDRSFFDFGLTLETLMREGYPWPGRYQLSILNGYNVLHNGTEKQKNEILPKLIRGELTMSISLTEPGAGTDVASLKTKATAKDGGFVIEGQKVFCSGAAVAKNIMIVGVRTDPTQKRNKGLTMLLVPSQTKGVEFRRLEALGRKIGGLYEVFFDNAWVPEENVLGQVNQGWKTLLSGLNVERAVVCGAYLGFGERIFKSLLENVQNRTRNNQKISSYSSVAERIAEFATEIEAARLLVYCCLYKANEGNPPIDEVSQTKMYCSELIKKLGDYCMEIGAGNAYLMSSIQQWYYRESRIVTIGGGSSQILRNIVGSVLGLNSK